MAAYAAVSSLMNNIEQMMSHPRLSTSFDSKLIQPLAEKAGFMLDFIEGCFNHGGGNSEEAQGLEKRIASAVHAADDVIESHIVDQIHAGTSEVSVRCSLDLQQIIQVIDVIIKEAIQVKQKWGELKFTHTAEGPFVESTEESGMVGLEDELTQLLDELTGYQSSRHIISIVGMGGTGKTTLATNIYQHALVKEHFEIRAWTTISQQYSAEEIITKLLSCIDKSRSGTSGDELYKTLYGRRYLIVLDDIWSVKAWDKVRRFFPDDGNRSRVVLTTRLSNVANDCGSSCLKMDLLDEDKSWKLFCVKALFPQKDDPPQLEDIGKQIVGSCKGLALSISVIGGLLLKSPRTVEYWMGVATDMKSHPDSKEKKESLDVMCLSYRHLPPHLKPCFLYMGVFREDSKIHVSNVINLWVGEGFIRPNGSREPEEVAEGYIKDLIDRNLILIGERHGNGNIKCCGIHDLMRDLCLKIGKEQAFFHVDKYNVQGTERRLVNYGLNDDQIELPLARSTICHGGPLIISRLIRVLYLHDNRWSTADIYGNVNLRYLDYQQPSGRRDYELPSSISLVWNLQTLLIRQPKLRRKLILAPPEFWKMRQLRHVDCGMIYLPKPPKDEVLMLEKLQTLKTVVNLILCEEVCNIIPNITKLHLKYADDRQGYDESYIKGLCNLDRFHKLESLNLSCDNWYVNDFTRIFKPRSQKPLCQDWLKKDPNELKTVLRFPSSLKKLSLSNCELGWEQMTMIASLHQLEVLHLVSDSVTAGEVWSPVNDQFLRLKFLYINLCQLIDWNVDNSHFPVLEKLLLLNLTELKEIPSGIGEIPTLKLIRVEYCSESAAISAIKIKEGRLENDDNDDLQVQVLMGCSNLERFKERVEREELTINNIELEINKHN